MTSSITNWNLNEPDFTSPLDGSLDSIRANYHYLLMVAAHGSVVLPGWNTTVTATDYSEPDTITLTRGTQRIIFNYTWTDGSVSAIQMCYDDGVSSPGLYCFPEIPFYYDSDGNPVGTVQSAFEDAVAALSPIALYTFRDDDFSTQILDSSGNDYHLTKQIAAATRDTSKIRSTHPGGALFGPTDRSSWASNGQPYVGGTELAVALSGIDDATVLVSLRVDSAADNYDHRLFGVANPDSLEGPDADLITLYDDISPSQGRVKAQRTILQYSLSTSTTGSIADGVPRLVVFRSDRNGTSGVENLWTTTSAGSALEDSRSPWNSGFASLTSLKPVVNSRAGTNTSAGSDTTGFSIDFIAVFNSYLSDSDLTNLQALYQAEVNS